MDLKGLTEYIQNYLENDRTHSALMLTGPWGCGKSFYVKNMLAEELSKSNHDTIIISLYGVKTIAELNRSLYLELRARKAIKKISAKITKTRQSKQPNKILSWFKRHGREVISSTFLISKTIIKGVAGFFHVSVDLSEKDMEKLFASINLDGKLIVLEDVERSSIDIIEIMGYVNNLVEQDGVKVLLVANEDEIKRYEKKSETEKNEQGETSKDLTEKSKEYVRIKEKTVSDTIYFHADLVASIESILRLFENAYFDGALKDRNAAGDFLIVDEIVKVMLEVDCFNLRAFLYSCQKTMEMFSKVQEKCEIEYFRFVLCSNTAFALKLSKNSNLVWTDNIKSPNELGSYHFPLYKCCYDYIKRQYFDCEQFIHDAVAYKKQKSFEVKQKDLSYALEMLYNFYYKTEKEVSESIRKIYEYLKTEENYIPFEEYGRLANYLIAVRKCVDDESLIDGCKDEILKKLRSKVLSNDIIHDLTYHNGIELWTREQQDEYNAFKQEMVNGIKAETSVVLEQVSTPEDIKKLTTSIQVNIERYVGKGNFAGQLDIVGILKVLPECDSEIISELRGAIMELYRSINIVDFLAADKPALISFKEGIKQLIADDEIKDKIKVLQLEWFIGNLDEIILKLDRQNY